MILFCHAYHHWPHPVYWPCHYVTAIILSSQHKPIYSDPTERILQAALQEGYIPHRDDKFLIHGPGGVGKSSLIAMFLGTQLDLTRSSTPVTTHPVHMTPIRDVSTSMFTADWKKVDYDRLSHMIANTSNYLFWKEKGGKEGKDVGEGKEEESSTSGSATEEASQSLAFLATPTVRRPSKKVNIGALASRFVSSLSKAFKKSPKSTKPSLATTLGDDPDNIRGLFSEFQEGLHDLVRESRGSNELLLCHSIHMFDSGGQPQFHELISIFIRGLTGIISVFKLSECLAVHGEVAFYKEGMLTNDPYKSYYTNEQVIRHDLQAIQSEATCCGTEEVPNLAFVGTHRDMQDTCPETPDAKDERLHSIITDILPPEMRQCVITAGGSLKQATFRINARSPDKWDFEMVGRLKEALMSRSRVKPRNLPIKWYGYLVILRLMMQKLERQTLSRTECEYIAHNLGFDVASMNAALDYLRQLNIIAYYEVLPDVVFGSVQVILDKITELVCYSLELKKGQSAVTGAGRKFLQEGIISLEFLRSAALSKHYTGNLFGPEDLLKVLVSRLVVTEVGKEEYIVPCVLDVSSIYPSPRIPDGSVQSSFIVHFSKKSPMFGIYCCTISSLMSDAGWKLLTEDGEVVQVARNSIAFEMPMKFPGKVTFSDPLTSYLEVTVELPSTVAAEYSTKLYSDVRDTFFTATKKAMETLRYEVRAPELSFLCPSSQCSTKPHPSILVESQGLLKCSLKPSTVCNVLTEEQKIWLPDAAGV